MDSENEFSPILQETIAKLEAARKAREEKEKESQDEQDKRNVRLRELFHEVISIPVICQSCKTDVEVRTGERHIVRSFKNGELYAYYGNDPAFLSVICQSCIDKKAEREMCYKLQLPERYRSFTTSGFEMRSEALEIAFGAVKRLSTAGEWIILSGKRGTGKTHLAVCALKHAYKCNRKGIYLSATEWIPRYVRAGFRRDELWDEYIVPSRVIMLDDLGQGEAAKSDGDLDDRARQEVGVLIDFCYRENRQMIITTNIERPDELMDRYGSWAVDRILECGEFVRMPSDLPSMRPSIRNKGV